MSLTIPVSAQGDDDPLYNIDPEGWFIITDDDGDIFYSTTENIEPSDGWEIVSLISSGDLVVSIQVNRVDDGTPNRAPSDPELFLGVNFGTWFWLNAFASNLPPDATLIFGDVETTTIDDIEFVFSSVSVIGFGVYTSYAYVNDTYSIIINIHHQEDTDIELAIDLLDTIEFLID